MKTPVSRSSTGWARFFRGPWKVLMPLGLVGLSFLIMVLLVLNKKPLVEEPPRIEGIPVEVAEIRQQGQRVEVYSQGTVQPTVRTELAAEVPGRVVEVSPNFVVGGFFKKGEVLLRLDDRDFQSRLTQAEAALASAQSRLAQEKGRAESAYRDWLGLNRDNRGSEATELALRKPQLAEAQARLQSAGAQLEEARLALERTVIRAPYNGLLQERQANVGQYLSAGRELGVIYATDSAEISLALPENKLKYIHVPAPGNKSPSAVRLYAEPGAQNRHWQARLVRSGGVFNEKNRTLSVIAYVEDPYGLRRPGPGYEPLRFGAFVRAAIEGRYFPKLVTLPNSLLRPGDKIWVVDKQNLLQHRSVSVLQTNSTRLYVSSGLQAGDRVCLTPLGNVLPGTPARVVRNVPAGQIFEPGGAGNRGTPPQDARKNGAGVGDGSTSVRGMPPAGGT